MYTFVNNTISNLPQRDSKFKIENFFSSFTKLEYRRREQVLGANENSGSVFYIKKGYLRAYRISEQGEELTMVILRPNDLFPIIWGGNSFLNNLYLETITPVEIYRAGKEDFLSFVKLHPEIFYDLANYVMLRFGGLFARIEYLVFGSAYTKVASTLLVCAKSFGEDQGGDVLVKLPLTHKDIATMVGITRETTCLEMKKLERKGLISHQGKLLLVKDIKGLEKESSLYTEENFLLNNSL